MNWRTLNLLSGAASGLAGAYDIYKQRKKQEELSKLFEPIKESIINLPKFAKYKEQLSKIEPIYFGTLAPFLKYFEEE
jgi:hypothetical protein